MESDIQGKYRAAIHEAGHIMTGAAIGNWSDIIEAEINSDNTMFAGITRFRCFTPQAISEMPATPQTIILLIRTIAELYGGLVAEKIWKKHKRIDYNTMHGGGNDLVKVDAYLAALHLPQALQLHLRNIAEYFAEQAILTNRGVFYKIADTLFERGHLTGEEIQEIAKGNDI